jgi:hypothetical protein
MNTVTVTNVEAKKNLLKVSFECKGKIQRFFNQNVFFTEYDMSIENVPEFILVIPFLSTVCPVAWACGADIYVKTVDEEFLQSLDKIKKTLQNFYPKVNFSGDVHANKIMKTEVNDAAKCMMLFSGGADSICTFVRHRDEKPVLAVVNGADIDLINREAWQTVIETSNDFAKQTGSQLRTIQSNFRAMLNEEMIVVHFKKQIQVSWWGGVMHGLAFLGLCAPLTYIDKIGILYIASSYTADFPEPWGSHPEIDNNVKWAGTTVVHDGYELSRQEKMFVIADYIKESNKKFIIRSCWEQETNANCSVCEKCSRTILGLEMAGIDPNDYGYIVNANTCNAMKKTIETEGWFQRKSVKFMWEDIQSHFRSNLDFPHQECKDLINWLAKTDLERFNQKTKPKRSLLATIRGIYIKYVPLKVYQTKKKRYSN